MAFILFFHPNVIHVKLGLSVRNTVTVQNTVKLQVPKNYKNGLQLAMAKSVLPCMMISFT